MNIIYQYTSPSGKSYIGKTKECREERRRYEHRWSAAKGSSTAFHNAINKYGIDSFYYKVLLCGIPDEIVNGMEIICINLYKPEYNITTGGDGVDSETARRNALQRWADPEDRARRVAAMKGKKKTVTERFRKAQSAKSLGKPNLWNTIEYTCPHCSKVGKGPNMKRYHFDNCKGRSNEV
jgi:hypothetical protein